VQKAGVQIVAVFRIAVIPADGIGPEITAEGVRVLRHIAALDPSVEFQFEYFPWGCEYYLETGQMMPDDGLDQLKAFDAIYLGAVGSPKVPDHISLHGLLLRIRKGFQQSVNLRPVKLLPGAPCPLVGKTPADIDMLFVRENTEGEYAGVGGRMYQGTPDEVALQTAVFSRRGTERVMRYAFETDKRLGKSVTSITKSNAQNYSMVLWDEVFREVAREYPTVPTAQLLVDAAAMFMVRNPERFQVVVASNLFADILTDLGAAIQGGMGFAAGANLNLDGSYPSMFEPVHGSAPDIAGKGIANPIAGIWTAKMMLDHLGLEHWGSRVFSAIAAVVAEGKVKTPDLGGNARTWEVTDAILEKL